MFYCNNRGETTCCFKNEMCLKNYMEVDNMVVGNSIILIVLSYF